MFNLTLFNRTFTLHQSILVPITRIPAMGQKGGRAFVPATAFVLGTLGILILAQSVSAQDRREPQFPVSKNFKPDRKKELKLPSLLEVKDQDPDIVPDRGDEPDKIKSPADAQGKNRGDHRGDDQGDGITISRSGKNRAGQAGKQQERWRGRRMAEYNPTNGNKVSLPHVVIAKDFPGGLRTRRPIKRPKKQSSYVSDSDKSPKRKSQDDSNPGNAIE